MLRARSPRFFRTLANILATKITSPRKRPAARLRLDNLEAREQPGSVVSGILLGGGMWEPLQAMTIVGDQSVPETSDMPRTDTVPEIPTQLPDMRLTASAELHDPPTNYEDKQAISTASTPSASIRVGIDLSDLSIADPFGISLFANFSDGGKEVGASSGAIIDASSSGSSQPATESLSSSVSNSAGSTTDQPFTASNATNAPFAGDSPTSAADSDPKPNDRNVGLSTGTGQLTVMRATGVASMPARLARVWAEAVNTRTGHGFRIWRDGSSGNLSVHYQLAQGSASESSVGRIAITDGNRSAAIVIPGPENAALTILAAPGYKVASAKLVVLNGLTAGTSSVTVSADTPTIIAGSVNAAGVMFSRTTTVGDLEVHYLVGGTAEPGRDYQPLSGTVVIPDGKDQAGVSIRPIADAPRHGHQTVEISVSAGDAYDVVAGAKATVIIQDPSSSEPVVPPSSIAGSPSDGGWSSNPVRYWDGKVWYQTVDLESDGFGSPWGVVRSWSNLSGFANDAYIGSGWIDVNAPRILASGSNIQLITNGAQASEFDLVSGSYVPQFFTPDNLTYDSSPDQFVLTDGGGNKWRFSNPSNTTIPVVERGQLVSYTDTYGNQTQVVGWRTDGKPTEVQRAATVGGVTTTESFLYAYVSGGTNDGLLAGVTLRRKVGSGSWATVREVDYTYYDGTTANGNAGDLESATVKDSAANTLSVEYYRYYKDSLSGGYTHGLKFALRPDSYAQFAAWCAANSTSVAAATDAQVSPFADHFFQYDATTKKATEEIAKGAGSSANGGLGTFTFAYTTATFTPSGFNDWSVKTVETLPDGNQNIVYTDYAGGVLLSAFKNVTTGDQWITYHHYNADGQLAWTAYPSAVTGYNDSYHDLLNFSLGTSSYLRDDAGLFELSDYYTSTTATSSTAGGVNGYFKGTSLRRGELGTPVPQGQVQFFTRSDGSLTIYPLAAATAYRNDDGTGGRTTSFAYTWGSGFDIQSSTITLPAVTTGQNGSGTAATSTAVFDGFGNVVWSRDPDGYLDYRAFDIPTGAVTKSIDDVDTAQTSTFAGLPSGWSTPTGGGLHLTTTATIDSLGRDTAMTDPNGNLTYFIFDDPNHGLRAYPGWNSSTGTTTGPTIVTRADWANGYTEAMTMSATPAVSSGVPTGTESVSNIQTLARDYYNTGGQLVSSDVYYDLTSLTYSTSVSLGTEGTNFNRTRFGYDAIGLQDRAVSPAGTIYRTWHDALGREASTWVGLDDTPTSGGWSPTNTTGTDLVKTSDSGFDGGGVGDGNLTSYIEYPGGGAAARESDFYYDWRNRLVAEKDGVETSESTSLNRPIQYFDYDNLNEVTEERMYDGDGVTMSTTDGVPNAPSSSLLRAQTIHSFDEMGQEYRTQDYSVDPSSGSVSSNSLTANFWFDSRGNLIKEADPGGLVTKDSYDGAGQLTAEYVTDGGGDSGYSDAGNVTGDTVLTQSEFAYDANSNPIKTTTRDRFHDASGTGALGTPTSGIHARVSYDASYFDARNRPTADVDVGTNGGSTYTRPSSAPSRSDTTLVGSYGYNAAGWESDATDPRGLIDKTYYDVAGRTTKTIENYVDGTVSDGDDKTIQYTYNPNSEVKTLAALLTGGGSQTTENVFGVSTSGGLVSNDLIAAVKHPDKSTGSASSSEQDSNTINQLGEAITSTDRNGTVHTYTYDVLGRLTVDAVTTLGSGVDGTIRRIEYSYDTQGNLCLITSYSAATSGSVVNQVQREFNGLGDLITEWQATNGSVNTSTSPKVQYAYAFAPSGSNNTDRLASITYPNGRVITYNYGSGVDDDISRLTSISDGATALESYAYLGLATVVKRAQGSGITLDYTTYSTSPAASVASNSVTSVSSTGDVAWSHETQAVGSDDRYADAYLTAGKTSEYLDLTDWGLSVPPTATVTGIAIDIEKSALPDPVALTSGYVTDAHVELLLNGTSLADEADTSYAWGGGDRVASYGGATDDWGAGLTGANVNDTSFGVRVQAYSTTASTVQIDDVQLTVYYTLPGGDKYAGLDEFGRVVDQAWVDGSGNAVDRRVYGYDSDSNRLYMNNMVSTTNSELYAYDGLNQLTSFQRGTLNSTNTAISGSPTRSQSWDFDALGNFDSQTTNVTTQTRSANKQNQITSISGATTPTYDANGNLTTDEAGQTYKYDAWDQLVEVKNSGGTTLATYRYDGLARRVRETRSGTTTDLYYSDDWQVLEERVGGSAVASYVWSPVYVDALVARDRDTDANGSLDERLYALQDVSWNVVALVNTSGTVVERYLYDSFGGVTVLDGSWGSRSSSSYAWVYLWQGLRRDSSTGLYGARNRDVSSTLGRALESDPIGFDGGDVNLYRWEGNMPGTVTDPTGLSFGLGDLFDELDLPPLQIPPWVDDVWNRLKGRMRGGLRGTVSGPDNARVFSGGGAAGAESGFGGVSLGGWGPDENALRNFGRWAWNELRHLIGSPSPTPWPDFKTISDGSAGWADHISGGATSRLRQAGGYDDAVDYNSRGYDHGDDIGAVHEFLMNNAGGGGPLRGGGKVLPGKIGGRIGGRGAVGVPKGIGGGARGGVGGLPGRAGFAGTPGLAPRVGSTTNQSKIVYRGLAKGENPAAGLFARSPRAGNSPASHVAGKRASQWISTSKSKAVARGWGGKHGIVAIDLSKVPSKVVDLSRGIPGKKGSMISNWAAKMKEVLVKDFIPPSAIKRIR
jgi:RHS repeat-associated protein